MLSDFKSDRTADERAFRCRWHPFVRICNPHAVNIGICNPAILFFHITNAYIPCCRCSFFALQMLIFHAVGFQIRQNGERMTVPLFSTRHALPK